MTKTYYRNGPWQVTDEFVRARGRSIQISTLESVDVSRKLFFLCLAVGGGFAGFGLIYADLLYQREIIGFVGLGLALLVLSWNVATLTIYSKLTGHKGWSITGWAPALIRMRGAIEEAVADRARRRGKRHAGAVMDDEEEGEEDETD